MVLGAEDLQDKNVLNRLFKIYARKGEMAALGSRQLSDEELK